MKGAIIGTGYWGKKLYKFFPKESIIGYINNGNSLIPELNKISFEEALDKVDYFIISCPIEHLSKYGIMALENNKHIFIEKPGSIDIDDLQKMIDLSKKNNLVSLVNYKFIKDSNIQKINNSSIISLEWNKYGSFNNDIKLNLLTHHLAVFIFIYGINNIGVFAQEDKLTCEFGKIAISKIDRTIKDKDNHFHRIYNNGKYHHMDSDDVLMAKQVYDFFNSIKLGKSPECDLCLSLDVLRLIYEI